MNGSALLQQRMRPVSQAGATTTISLQRTELQGLPWKVLREGQNHPLLMFMCILVLMHTKALS